MSITERFKGASWFNYRSNVNIFIGGAGGIGSNLVYLLSKSDIRCNVMDDDVVEEHNIGGQFYSLSQMGQYKVKALSNSIYNMINNTYVNSIPKRIENADISYLIERGLRYSKYPIFVCAFDNMAARKKMFQFFKYSVTNCSSEKEILFVDGRLSAEYFKYFVFNGSEDSKIYDYETNHLKDDSEYEEENCTFKQTVDVAMMLASKMSIAIKSHITNNISNEGGVKQIPYVEEYSASLGQTLFNLTV